VVTLRVDVRWYRRRELAVGGNAGAGDGGEHDSFGETRTAVIHSAAMRVFGEETFGQ